MNDPAKRMAASAGVHAQGVLDKADL